MGHHRRHSGATKLKPNRAAFTKGNRRGSERVLLLGDGDDQFCEVTLRTCRLARTTTLYRHSRSPVRRRNENHLVAKPGDQRATNTQALLYHDLAMHERMQATD